MNIEKNADENRWYLMKYKLEYVLIHELDILFKISLLDLFTFGQFQN